MVHDAAAISYLPELVDRSLLQQGNARIGGVFAVAGATGNHLGAALAALTGPARALTGDALSYLVSIWCTTRIHTPGPPPLPAPVREPLGGQIRDGLRYVARHPTLATLTLVNATIAVGVGVGVLVTLWPLYALRTLAMPGTVFGMILGAGALGAATGALLAPRLARRYGPGPMMLAALALTLLTQIPLLFAGPGAPWQTALGAAQFVHMACAGAAGVTQRTVRQLVAEPAMQARMQAVSTWLCAVARPLAVPFLALARSPLRGLRRMPPASGPADTPSAPGGERAGAAVPPPAAEPDGAAPSGTGPEGGAR